jgi:hypothetical protein
VIRTDPRERHDDDIERVPDVELAVAAALLGVVVLLATLIVPLIG